MKELLKQLRIIAAENPKGFTVTVPDLEPVLTTGTGGICTGCGQRW